MLSRASKTILVLTGTNALKVKVHSWSWKATSVSGPPSWDHRGYPRSWFCKPSLFSSLRPCQATSFWITWRSISFLPVSQRGSVQDLLRYFPHANRETDVGHQVKHLKSIVSCQGCKGRLSQKLILSICSSSRYLPWWGKTCFSLGQLCLFFFFPAIAFLQRDEAHAQESIFHLQRCLLWLCKTILKLRMAKLSSLLLCSFVMLLSKLTKIYFLISPEFHVFPKCSYLDVCSSIFIILPPARTVGELPYLWVEQDRQQ